MPKIKSQIPQGNQLTEPEELRSDDGNVHISAWEKPSGGTMGSYENKIEYKWGGKTLHQVALDSGTGEALMPLKDLYILRNGKEVARWPQI